MTYTIIATSGDNGEQHCVGSFGTFRAACDQAHTWQEADNPTYDRDGVSYQVSRIMPIREWAKK